AARRFLVLPFPDCDGCDHGTFSRLAYFFLAPSPASANLALDSRRPPALRIRVLGNHHLRWRKVCEIFESIRPWLPNAGCVGSWHLALWCDRQRTRAWPAPETTPPLFPGGGLISYSSAFTTRGPVPALSGNI